jgi:hypothetical protein
VRRIFWVALGLGAGATAAVLSSRWMRRQAEKVAPANVGREISNGMRDLGQLMREALAEGRQAMQEKEAEIRASLE